MQLPNLQRAKILFVLIAGGISLAVAAFVFPLILNAQTLTPEQERTKLEKELAELEKEIATYENNIQTTQQEKQTLQNQIYILRNKISQLDAQVRQSNKLIGDLRTQIGDTTTSIEKTEGNITATREQLENILQRMYQEDNRSSLEVLFSGDDFSDFFDNVMALETLNARSRELLTQLYELNLTLRGQKENLEDEKAEEENLVKISLLQKQESRQVQQEREYLLSVTKGKEEEYQRILTDKRQQAQEIRNRIFDLIGVPDAPTFGEAVAIAEYASVQTGVRPAFLLAILTQESNIGKNVGQCYLKDPATGDGIVIYNGRIVKAVMKPTRDVQPFLAITRELGRDPYNTPVSCPIPSVGGYGGAMGPAQFIPSTWALYDHRIEAIIGQPADPWNIRDAFLASAVYLSDLGAAQRTRNAEWCAAISYFSGRCNSAYSFYGNSVLAIADRYEADIQTLREAQ